MNYHSLTIFVISLLVVTSLVISTYGLDLFYFPWPHPFYSQAVFKPGVPAFGRRVPGFLKLLLSATLVCVCACVCVRPRGYKLHSRDIEPVQPAEQVRCV